MIQFHIYELSIKESSRGAASCFHFVFSFPKKDLLRQGRIVLPLSEANKT